MPQDSVKDARGQGSLRQKTAGSAGPADVFSSKDVVAADGILIEHQNQYVPVSRVYGDGRRYTPVQSSTPASPAPGQYWIETVLGVDYWVFVDAAGTPQYLSPTGSGVVPTPTITALPSGVPTTIETVLVDSVGLIEWSTALYSPSAGARIHYRLVAAHDGTSGSDATEVQLSKVSTVALGTIDADLTLTLTGSGAGQTMNLVATASAIGWSAASVVERMVAP